MLKILLKFHKDRVRQKQKAQPIALIHRDLLQSVATPRPSIPDFNPLVNRIQHRDKDEPT